MVKSAKKSPSAFSSMFDLSKPNEPKTLKGKANKAMTGDGRKGVKNLSKEEAVNLANGMFGVGKKTSKK